MVLFIVTFRSCLWGEMPLAIVVPSRWICKFLKPISCSTLGLKGLIGSLKDLFAHMISAQGLRLQGQPTNWKPCPRCRVMLYSGVFWVFRGKDNIWCTMSCPPPPTAATLGDEEKGSQYAVTESGGNSVFKGERTLLVRSDKKCSI